MFCILRVSSEENKFLFLLFCFENLANGIRQEAHSHVVPSSESSPLRMSQRYSDNSTKRKKRNEGRDVRQFVRGDNVPCTNSGDRSRFSSLQQDQQFTVEYSNSACFILLTINHSLLQVSNANRQFHIFDSEISTAFALFCQNGILRDKISFFYLFVKEF